MGEFFADVHAMPDSQIENLPCTLKDSPEVLSLRQEESYDGLIRLAGALCYQLRYREAIPVYSAAIALQPDNRLAYRLRAPRYLNTLQPALALGDFLTCRTLGGDAVDLSYRMGLCLFLMGKYAWAMEEFSAAYTHSDEEMQIAEIYWHTLCAWRSGEPETMLAKYRAGMDVGHHFSYERVMALAAGYLKPTEFEELLQTENSDLEYSILAYGYTGYLEKNGKKEEAKALRDSILRRDGFWISYAYLAALNDKRRNAR